MKRKLYAVVLLLLAVCMLLLWELSNTTVYVRKDIFGQVTALWRTNESFAFLEIDTIVEKDSKRAIFLAKHAGLYGFNPNHLTPNLLTFHFKDGKLMEYKQSNFDLSGQLFTVSNAPALLRGGYRTFAFRWENGKFVEINESDLQKTNYAKFATNDWHKLDWEQVGHVGPGYNKNFAIGNAASITLKMGVPTLNKEGYVAKEAPFAFELSVPNHKTISMTLPQEYHEISKEEFEAVIHPTSSHQSTSDEVQ